LASGTDMTLEWSIVPQVRVFARATNKADDPPVILMSGSRCVGQSQSRRRTSTLSTLAPPCHGY